MNKDIINKDKNGHWHGVQITYWSNGNIMFIDNYHHGKWHGYSGWFNLDKSIEYKAYWNMGKRLYDENHWVKQIQIKI